MNCIMTVLTVFSVFTGGQWGDVEVSTNSKFVTNMNEQVSAKVEMLSETYRKSETITVTCGSDIYATTASVLETKD